MIYFDNAATGGAKPPAVAGAVAAALEGCANPGRGGHAAAAAAAENVLRCRKLLCRFFGGESWERVVFTKNCTEALNAAIFGLAHAAVREEDGRAAGSNARTAGSGRAKPHFVTTEAEHNAVLRPLYALERAGIADVSVVPLQGGAPTPEGIAAAVRENTVAAVFTLASNVTGAAVDPAAVRALLPARVLTVCDGAQACGHIPVDMRGTGIDALAVAGHKGMHGIQGAGALLLSERCSPAPLLYGGTGSASADADMPDFYPDRLEAGTLSCPAIASLAEGALYLAEHMREDAKKLEALTARLCEGLAAIRGIRVYSRPNPCGIVAFACETLQSELFAQALSDGYGIAVRGGLHCAPRMHAALGSDGLVRASLSAFNTAAEAEAFLSAVRAVARGAVQP